MFSHAHVKGVQRVWYGEELWTVNTLTWYIIAC